jgi:hypothetical protein
MTIHLRGTVLGMVTVFPLPPVWFWWLQQDVVVQCSVVDIADSVVDMAQNLAIPRKNRYRDDFGINKSAILYRLVYPKSSKILPLEKTLQPL